MTWHVTPILPADVRAMWMTVVPLLAPAIAVANGRTTMRSTYARLMNGHYLLWVAHEDDMVVRAAFLSRETQYPDKRVLTIEAAGGSEMDGWLAESVRVFRAHSREAGLSGVEMFGRQGWARALRKHGWRQTAVLCEIDT